MNLDLVRLPRIPLTDPCGTLLMAGAVAWVGRQVIGEHVRANRVGWLLAAGVFLLFVVNGTQRGDLPSETLTNATCAGLFTLGASWFVLAVMFGMFTQVSTVAGWLGGFGRSWRWLADASWQVRERERKELLHATERERLRPEKERERGEAEARSETERQAQQRRDSTRAELLLCYLRHAPDLKEKMPRELFDEYCMRFLTDALSPEIVEERARQLQQAILEQVEHVEPARRFQSLAELQVWHREKQTELETLPAGRTREFLQSELRRKFDEMTLELFGERQ